MFTLEKGIKLITQETSRDENIAGVRQFVLLVNMVHISTYSIPVVHIYIVHGENMIEV